MIKHYGESSIKEGARVQIPCELDHCDVTRFTLYRSLENADVKWRKTVLWWMVVITLSASIPAFQLERPTAIPPVLVICSSWLVFCDMFMNHTLLKQILKEHKETACERIEIISAREPLLIHTGKKQHSYPYEEITYFLYFKKLLLLTLYDGFSILTPRRAFNSNHDYKALCMHILNHCPQ